MILLDGLSLTLADLVAIADGGFGREARGFAVRHGQQLRESQ